MGRDQMCFPMEMCFWENITMARQKDMVSIAGLMETFTVACLSTVANKGRVLGRNLVQKKIRTCTRENITMTLNMVMESSNGQLEVITGANT